MGRRAALPGAILALALSIFAAAPSAVADEPGGAVYVALGDSEAAGTGNLPYEDQECLRSGKKAYPEVLGALIGGVSSYACAGATTQEVLATQLSDLGPATQLVTLTAGVNDLGWQGVLAACSSAGTDAACAAAAAAAAAALQGVPMGIAQIVGAVRLLAPNAMIVVTGYPMLFGDVVRSCSVGNYQGTPVKFTAEQAAAVNAGLIQLNAAVRAGVDAYRAQTGDIGTVYLDVAAGFDGHGLCDTGDRWISGLAGGKASDRGFHPNVRGQQQYAAIIADALGL